MKKNFLLGRRVTFEQFKSALKDKRTVKQVQLKILPSIFNFFLVLSMGGNVSQSILVFLIMMLLSADVIYVLDDEE